MIIGTGVDIIEISRLQAAITRNDIRFIRRVFTVNEQAYCDARHPREIHYAGRFAAKEAALKALGTGWAGGMKWTEVEVEVLSSGAPQLKLHGEALARCQLLNVTHMHLSISHCQQYAVAMVVMETKD